MSVFDDDVQPLTRADFDTQEDWFRYRHEAGERPFVGSEPFHGITSSGHYGALAGAIYGHTRREHQHAFEEYGVSDHIRSDQFLRNFRAVALANCLGYVLNTYIDITWSTVGVTRDAAVAARQQEFVDWLTRWLRRKGIPALWIWSLERGTHRGVHTHMMVHIPSDLYLPGSAKALGKVPFAKQAKEALAHITGRPLVETSRVKTVRVRHRSSLRTSNQWFAFRYRMKGTGTAPGLAEQLGLWQGRDEGRIGSKRTGVSRLLDNKSAVRLMSANAFPPLEPGRAGDSAYDDRFVEWHRANRGNLRLPNCHLNGNVRNDAGFVVESIS